MQDGFPRPGCNARCSEVNRVKPVVRGKSDVQLALAALQAVGLDGKEKE